MAFALIVPKGRHGVAGGANPRKDGNPNAAKSPEGATLVALPNALSPRRALRGFNSFSLPSRGLKPNATYFRKNLLHPHDWHEFCASMAGFFETCHFCMDAT